MNTPRFTIKQINATKVSSDVCIVAMILLETSERPALINADASPTKNVSSRACRTVREKCKCLIGPNTFPINGTIQRAESGGFPGSIVTKAPQVCPCPCKVSTFIGEGVPSSSTISTPSTQSLTERVLPVSPFEHQKCSSLITKRNTAAATRRREKKRKKKGDSKERRLL